MSKPATIKAMMSVEMPEVAVTTKGRVTVAFATDGVFTGLGIAQCHPIDLFDEVLGIELAMGRALRAYGEAMELAVLAITG